MCWSWLQRYVQEEAWNFLHGLEEEVPCTVETLQLYASWLFFSAWLGSVWLGDFTNQRTWREASNKSILRHFSSISCSHCGSLDQVSFNVAKCPFKTFFAVARIPSPVIDIRLHDHNITARWSQKRSPFCSENRVILMQIVSTRSGCPVPWLPSGAFADFTKLTVFSLEAQEDFLAQHGVLAAAGGTLVTTSKSLEEAENALRLGSKCWDSGGMTA